MTIGEKLLELTAEYQQAKEAEWWPQYNNGGRTTEAIAADYEETLKTLLA